MSDAPINIWPFTRAGVVFQKLPFLTLQLTILSERGEVDTHRYTIDVCQSLCC